MSARPRLRDSEPVTRFRRAAVWAVILLLVLTLVATLVLAETA